VNDSFTLEDPTIMISWIPMNKKTRGVSLITSPRDNAMYNNYGYIESEMCILNSFAEDNSSIKGRRLADGWLRKLETFIKNRWNNIISGVGIVLSSFNAFREIPEFFSERLYGLETRFEMQSWNNWTDEPVSGATSLTDITGVTVKNGIVSGFTGMIDFWVI